MSTEQSAAIDRGPASVNLPVSVWVLGGLFLAAYLRWRNNGMLIPAGILLGLGLGFMFRDQLQPYGEPLNIGLGAGFIFIYVAALIYERESHWWPLIPGSVLLLMGFGFQGSIEFLLENWPLLLVLVGAILVTSALLRSRKPNETNKMP